MHELDRLVQDPFRRREVTDRGETVRRVEPVVVPEPTVPVDEVAPQRSGRVLRGVFSAVGRVVRRPAGEPLVAAVG